MLNIVEFLKNHAEHAPFFLFGLTLLAGLNIPISIDLLMITAAIFAATLIPEHFYTLFFSMFFGCILSAWIAYWLGRKSLKLPFLVKFLPQKRLEKMRLFFQKRGFFALFLGRFIPFGVRNLLYMSCGASSLSFPKFILWEGISCTVWALATFSLYYTLGANIQLIYSHVKSAGLSLFILLSVTVIGAIWYNKRKNRKGENV